MRKHLHDPNAPELVHFLITPLSLIVEASKDPGHGTPDLASKVVSPLLTAEAKELLKNCLTSKEADLWLSLGDAWTVSRYVLMGASEIQKMDVDEWTVWTFKWEFITPHRTKMWTNSVLYANL